MKLIKAFHFQGHTKDNSRSNKVVFYKVPYKVYSFNLYIVMGLIMLIISIFGLILCMSTISRHVPTINIRMYKLLFNPKF